MRGGTIVALSASMSAVRRKREFSGRNFTLVPAEA
jgi:hypothetical protein